MTPYESTRNKLSTLVKSFHAASYPTTEVNYPGKWITDIEHQTDPFVTVEMDINLEHLDMQVTRCVRAKGQLVCNHFSRQGSGSKIFTEYADALQAYLGLQTLLEVTFREVNSYSNKNIDGFDGRMNIVIFQVEYYT